MKSWLRIRSRVTLLAAIALAGCGSDPGFNENTDFVTRQGSVQFVNMMPDSPEVTVLHGLSQDLVQFPFTSGVLIRPQDKYDWRIAYLDSGNRDTTITGQDDQQITENVLSTFLMMGTVTQPDVQIVDIFLTPLDERPEDSAEIWFASNLTGSSMVDIYLTDFGADLGANAPLMSLNSGTFSEVITVPAGTEKQLRITTAGTTDLLFDSGVIIIPGQSLDLMALVDDFGPEGSAHADVIRSITTTGTTIIDVSQIAEARVSSFSGIEPIEVSVSTTSFTDVQANERTAFASVPTGTLTVTVTGGGSTLSEQSGSLSAGRYHSILLFDDSTAETQPAVVAAIILDEFRNIADRVLFQFVNGSGQTIDFFALRDDETTDNVAPTFDNAANAASGVVEVLTGQTRFVVTSSDGSETLDSTDVNLVEGNSYTIVFDTSGGIQTLQN